MTGIAAAPSVMRKLATSPIEVSEPSSTSPPMRKRSLGAGGASATWDGERKKLMPSRMA